MANSRLLEVTEALVEVVGPSRPAAVISSATLAEQRIVTGALAEIAQRAVREGLTAPATLVVGEVASQAAARHREVVDLTSFG